MNRHQLLSRAAALAALYATLATAVVPAQAQEWPNKPVRVIVPFPPGGGTDTVAVFPDVLVAATRVPAKTLPELIAYAKANPGKVKLRIGRQRHHAAPGLRDVQCGCRHQG